MTPRELKRLMRERKRALRAQVAAMPAVRRARRRRWLRRGVAGVIVGLMLLFIRCDCDGDKLLPQPAAEDAGVTSPPPKPPKPVIKAKSAPLDGKLPSQPRPSMAPQGAAGPPWLDEFRVQVAARSPRLAQCFTGTERPGALRWSALVNPQGGAVADQELEPVGVGTDLTQQQRECVATVLAKPPYRLSAPGAEGLPDRVSLVIEF